MSCFSMYYLHSPIIRRLFVAEELPTGDKAVFAFLEMVALEPAFEGVSALLNGKDWMIVAESLAASLASS